MRNKLLVLLSLLLVSSLSIAGPKIEQWKTKNGARVFYVNAPQLPIVDLRIVFDAGSARDADKPGLAALTNSLLDEGTGTLNADQVAEQFEGIGAQFGASSLRDMAVVSIRSLNDKVTLDKALDLFSNVVAKPTLPEESFQRNRKAMLVGLKVAKQRPNSIASKAYYKQVFGDHPYAIDGSGTEESLTAMKRQDVIDYHGRYYVANNAVIAIVGAVSRADAAKLAEKVTSRLAAGEAAATLPKVKPLTAATTKRIKHKSQQTHILVGQPGMHRGDPDYITLYVGNHVLGGSGLVSRLSEQVREQRGLAYSAYSYFSPMREDGPFTMGLQTKNSQADEALALLNKIIKEYVENGPTEQELKRSKQNITGGFALRVDSNKKIVEYIAMIGFYGLSLDYLDTFNDRVEAVTVEKIKDAFKRRIHPDKLVTIMVGGE